jgi:ribosomal protein S18 acetylase RimI-like enzyme
MEVFTREYHPEDKPQLIELMGILQDYLVNIDPIRRLRRLSGFGEAYTEALLKKVIEQHGVIYLAQQGQAILACIAGFIEDQPAEDLLGSTPSKSGRIAELVVKEEFRNQGIGSILVKRMEDYFRLNSCDIVRVEVFAPNTDARDFYSSEQYSDRVIDMVKKL